MAQITPEPGTAGSRPLQLPPLILHPFTDQEGSSRFLENSKASLMLSGLLPDSGFSREELTERVVRARYLEVRMLYFLGKDVFRWVEQCVESVERARSFEHEGIREQSFTHMLTHNTPTVVQEKLRGWGVYDFASIFTRALGLHTAFAEPPAISCLSQEFILSYHLYADFLYSCYDQLRPYTEIAPGRFEFEVFGSGEYSRMLESQWEAT